MTTTGQTTEEKINALETRITNHEKVMNRRIEELSDFEGELKKIILDAHDHDRIVELEEQIKEIQDRIDRLETHNQNIEGIWDVIVHGINYLHKVKAHSERSESESFLDDPDFLMLYDFLDPEKKQIRESIRAEREHEDKQDKPGKAYKRAPCPACGSHNTYIGKKNGGSLKCYKCGYDADRGDWKDLPLVKT